MDEMCPYCGSELPGPVQQCPTCAAILEEVDDEVLENIKPVVEEEKLEPCPHCEARMPIGIHRCKDCGRVINEREEGEEDLAWKYGPTVAFAGVALFVVLIILLIGLTRDTSEPREYKKLGFGNLAMRYNPKRLKNTKARARERWDKEYKNFYVVWSGTVVKVDGEAVEFAITSKAVKDKTAEVRVTFLPEADEFVGKLKPGQTVAFDAKLIDYNKDGYVFLLERGLEPQKE